MNPTESSALGENATAPGGPSLHTPAQSKRPTNVLIAGVGGQAYHTKTKVEVR